MEIKRIVWATDFNPVSNYAFEWAKLIGSTYKSTIYALHVIPEKKPIISLKREEFENMFDILEKKSYTKAKEILERKTKDLKEKIEIETVLLRGDPPSKIIEFLNETNSDLLIIGTTGKREKQILGTTAYRILTNVRIPVLVIPSEREVKIKKILVPVDFSKLSFKALEYALNLGLKFNAEIYLLHIAELLESIGIKESEQKILSETKGMLKRESERFKGKYKIFIHAIKRDSAEIGILEFAQEHDIDLICMASRGRRGLSYIFLGSTTEKVIKLSERPVLAFNPLI